MAETTCPVFRPTEQEFKSFRRYIEDVVDPIAGKAGLCKVIPPPGEDSLSFFSLLAPQADNRLAWPRALPVPFVLTSLLLPLSFLSAEHAPHLPAIQSKIAPKNDLDNFCRPLFCCLFFTCFFFRDEQPRPFLQYTSRFYFAAYPARSRSLFLSPLSPQSSTRQRTDRPDALVFV